MATVQISDIYVPNIYNSLDSINSPELTAYFNSGVAVASPALSDAFAGGGRNLDLPFWKDLDQTIEQNYSTDNPADIAVPQKIQTGVMSARIAQMNQAWSTSDLAVELASGNPLQQIKNRIGTYWTRRFQRRIIATSLGIMNANIAQNSGDMVSSIALETTVGVSSANLFSRLAFINAIMTAGDHFEQFSAVAVHSMVYKTMLINDDITFTPDSTGTFDIPYFMGKRVIIDDSLPVIPGSTSGFKYVSIIFGAGFIGYGFKAPPNPSWVKREETQGNGGGIEIIGERTSMVIHPYGYNWTNNTITGGYSPSDANLQLAANWSRIVTRKQTPIAFLVTNG